MTEPREKSLQLPEWDLRALLRGVKTEMRFPVRLTAKFEPGAVNCSDDGHIWWLVGNDWVKHVLPLRYQVGDHLWVREEIFRRRDREGGSNSPYTRNTRWYYREGEAEVELPPEWPVDFELKHKFKPARMPRIAARLILEVTGVRAERLQDIEPKGAIAEGCMPSSGSGLGTPEQFREAARLSGFPGPRGIFAMLWERQHGEGAWERNNWVEVYTFQLNSIRK